MLLLQLKPELMPVDAGNLVRKMKGVVTWDRSKEEQEEKEVSVKQAATEPTRIKIFEGGYVPKVHTPVQRSVLYQKYWGKCHE